MIISTNTLLLQAVVALSGFSSAPVFTSLNLEALIKNKFPPFIFRSRLKILTELAKRTRSTE